MTLESLARTIAKARHGTDAMWANYMGAAEAVVREMAKLSDDLHGHAQAMLIAKAPDTDADTVDVVWDAVFERMLYDAQQRA
ncbi:hypothetical protein [Mesorhizobium sp.]|uniref:hypothetical protein n=1 Tax=Mesorhizobium sp. TaxID=1871066 RepID=UPI000FE62700|nr:hypothetical protein [Mesorhizobium sp.]RWO08256.1 MAG: hypothetical protein EOS15_30045 [Mesorhizobium sp.]